MWGHNLIPQTQTQIIDRLGPSQPISYDVPEWSLQSLLTLSAIIISLFIAILPEILSYYRRPKIIVEPWGSKFEYHGTEKKLGFKIINTGKKTLKDIKIKCIEVIPTESGDTIRQLSEDRVPYEINRIESIHYMDDFIIEVILLEYINDKERYATLLNIDDFKVPDSQLKAMKIRITSDNCHPKEFILNYNNYPIYVSDASFSFS